MRLRRRTTKRIKNINSKLLAIILIIVVFTCSTAYAYFSQNLSLQGMAKLAGDNPYCKLDLFEGYKELSVEYEYIYYHQGQQILNRGLDNPNNDTVTISVQVRITNNGTKNVNAWRAFVMFPENAQITHFWNATNVYEGAARNGKILVFDHPSIYYNNVIAPGQTISFNVEYNTTDRVVEISEIVVYGWDTSIESVPELEDMAGCIYDGNSSGGTINPDNPDPDTPVDPDPDNPVDPDPDNPNPDNPVDPDPDNPDPDTPVDPDPDNPVVPDDPDDNTITSLDGRITASVENRYQRDDNGISYYATVITLTNNTDEIIDNWYIKLDLGEGGEIPGCWTATCEQNGGVVTITPPTWGVVLYPSNPYTIEFQTTTNQVEPKVIETGTLE